MYISFTPLSAGRGDLAGGDGGGPEAARPAPVGRAGAGYYIGKAGYTNFSKATPAALTSITFFNSTDTTNFDAGSIKVYGVK